MERKGEKGRGGEGGTGQSPLNTAHEREVGKGGKERGKREGERESSRLDTGLSRTRSLYAQANSPSLVDDIDAIRYLFIHLLLKRSKRKG